MTQVLEVTTTAPDQATAQQLAESAVCGGFAAGAQVAGPVTSYAWVRGECARREEWTVTLTTSALRYADLASHLTAEHESPAPPISAVPVAHASASLSEWVSRSTSRPTGERSRVSVAHEAAGDGFDGF